MAQDPSSIDNDANNYSPDNRATPAGPDKQNALKLKYEIFLKRVKSSALKAKDEARRKRVQQQTVKAYKNNERIISAQQHTKNYTLSIEQLRVRSSAPPSAEQSSNRENQSNENEEAEEAQHNVMADDWECIVIHKNPSPPKPNAKPKPPANGKVNTDTNKENKAMPLLRKAVTAPNILSGAPKQAPPPIPHERRGEIEAKLNKNKSNPMQMLFNQLTKKSNPKPRGRAAPAPDNYHPNDAMYDEDAFNLDSGLEEHLQAKLQEDTSKRTDSTDAESKQEGDVKTVETERQKEKLTITLIKWQWCDDAGEWNNYGSSTSKEMEAFYQNGMEKYEYDIFGRIYVIDFKEMKQINNLNQAWKVRRKEIVQEI